MGAFPVFAEFSLPTQQDGSSHEGKVLLNRRIGGKDRNAQASCISNHKRKSKRELATYERITKAMDELGFVPDRTAISLRKENRNTVGPLCHGPLTLTRWLPRKAQSLFPFNRKSPLKCTSVRRVDLPGDTGNDGASGREHYHFPESDAGEFWRKRPKRQILHRLLRENPTSSTTSPSKCMSRKSRSSF